MSEKDSCVSCRKPKGLHACGLCGGSVCRDCEIFLAEGTFAFLAEVASDLKHTYYCAPCHERVVAPELDGYNEILARAKEVFFFFDTRKKPIQTLKKALKDVSVPFCEDRDETILRLGFMAASQGFNAVIDASVVCEKVRDHGWQKMKWKGSGRPANVDAEKLERHERF